VGNDGVTDLPAESADGAGNGSTSVVGAIAQIPEARREIGRAGSRAGLSPAAVERLTVATHEILANAIVHGGGQASVSVQLDDGRMVVTVTDPGSGWTGGVPAVRPDRQQLGGRGLWLARNLCDDLTIAHDSTGTTVRLFMNIPG
jgi:anti-sigma regulatory factor (Ser/Thr protein kinase)